MVAHRVTPTNVRLGTVLSPAQALARLRTGDIALGRLDVLPSLDGVQPGLWALDRLAALGVTVLNGRGTLVAAHDKLATAEALHAAGVPQPETAHVAPWAPVPPLAPPLVLKPRFGSWGADVVRCDDEASQRRACAAPHPALVRRDRRRRAAARAAARGYDLRLLIAGGQVAGAVRRIAPGERRSGSQARARDPGR